MSRFDVRAYAEDRLKIDGEESNRVGGTEIVATCFECGRSRHLYIEVKTGKFHCFGCGIGGGLPRLLVHLDGVSYTEARSIIRAALKLPGLSVPLSSRRDRSAEPEEEGPREPEEIGLPAEFVPVWDPERRLWKVPLYMRDRGIRARTAAIYRLGFCLKGPYAHRLIFPAHMDGKIRGFQGRAMCGQEPKYHGPAARKGDVLFGYDEALGSDEIVVCEGPIDVTSLAQKGFAAVSLMGKRMSKAQVAALRRGGVRRAILMLDPDARRNMPEVDDLVSALFDDVRGAFLPAGVDPGSASAEIVQRAVDAARPIRMRDRVKCLTG